MRFTVEKMDKTDRINFFFEGFQVSFLSLGATIEKILVKKEKKYENITLSFADVNDYLSNPSFLGTTIGPICGRVNNGQLSINNQCFKLPKNHGNHHIHGGREGFSFIRFPYRIIEMNNSFLLKFYVEYDQSLIGLPGYLTGEIVYTISMNKINIDYSFISSEDTVFNITNHSYFNLSGNYKRNVLDHKLMVKAPNYLKLNNELIPIRKSLVNKSLDFRIGKRIGTHINDEFLQLSPTSGYDHCWIFDETSNQIELVDYEAELKLSISTSYPSVVIYTYNHVNNSKLFLDSPDFKYAGIAIECQNEPNGSNLEDCIDRTLRKGKPFRHYISYTLKHL